ncbi:MAG: hypothetical protein K2G89_05195 [Lachnospiraceae bacterium]|nr:hypothetical protein [Lachnospiraceae bacterium]
MSYGDIGLIVLELLVAGGLFWLASYAEKALSTKWKLCYTIPMILCIFAIALFGFEVSMLGVYLGALCMLAGFMKEEKRLRRVSAMAAGVLTVISLGVCMINPEYRTPDYVEEFKESFSQLKLHYNMAEHKNIDWDTLYEEYLPQFQKADKEHDEKANALAWELFVQEFHDCHVSYMEKKEDILNGALERIAGNDYGLSLMTLENGKTVAVNVETDSLVYQAGIRNGTVITAWDGVEIKEAIDAYNRDNKFRIHAFAVKENEDFYRAMLVAGTGGDSVNISYLDDAGTEKTVLAGKLGNYKKRLEDTVDVIDQGVAITNLAWQNIDDETALMRMRFMSYDKEENFDQMSEEVRTKLLVLKDRGVKHLIFDMRSNSGGSDEYVKALIKLIAPEGEHTYAYDGVFDKKTMRYLKDENTGRYLVGERECYQGENLWGHGDITILVNTNTVSAGDHFSMLASAFPNVTIMGFTHSSCSAQGINSVQTGHSFLAYSSVLLLNEDGSVFIDTDETREATVPLDIKIPFDERAVAALFDDGEDYVLSYVMSLIEK